MDSLFTMESTLLERMQSCSEAGPRPAGTSPRKPSDIFSQENFDATAYINEMFPTGDSPNTGQWYNIFKFYLEDF